MAEDEQNKKELQARVVNPPSYKAKNRWLDQLKGTNEAAEVFEDVVEAEYGMDDARGKVSYDEAKEDTSVQYIAGSLDMMLNAKV